MPARRMYPKAVRPGDQVKVNVAPAGRPARWAWRYVEHVYRFHVLTANNASVDGSVHFAAHAKVAVR